MMEKNNNRLYIYPLIEFIEYQLVSKMKELVWQASHLRYG